MEMAAYFSNDSDYEYQNGDAIDSFIY